jgi:hypothetical protein
VFVSRGASLSEYLLCHMGVVLARTGRDMGRKKWESEKVYEKM